MRFKTTAMACLLATAFLIPVPMAAYAQDREERPTRRPQNPERPERPATPQRAADAPVQDRAIAGIEFVNDVVYAEIERDGADARPLTMDVAFPSQGGDDPLPAVIYIHGGGWQQGNKEQGRGLIMGLARGGYMAASVGYRLSGEATFPAALHDVKAAVRFIRANAEELGVDPERIGVFGHSAGGHLSAMLGVTGSESGLEGTLGPADVSSAVTCVVSLAGPTDLTALSAFGREGHGMVNAFLGGSPEAQARIAQQASPVTHVHSGAAPMLLLHGTNDTLVPPGHARALHDRLSEVNAPVQLSLIEGEGHALQSREVLHQTAAFFDRHLGGHAAELFAVPAGEGSDAQEERPGRPQPRERRPDTVPPDRNRDR